MTKILTPARLGALLALFLAAPASAANWRVVLIPDAVAPFGRSIAFVDADSIVRQGDEVRFTYDIRFQQDGELWGLRTPSRASCTAFWYELDGTTAYRGETATEPTAPTPRQQAEEESNIRGVIEGVCTNTFLSGAVDIAAHSRAFFASK